MSDIGTWAHEAVSKATIPSGEDPAVGDGWNDNLLQIKTAVNSKLDKSGSVTSFPTVGADVPIAAKGTATALATGYNSYDLYQSGSIWDGAAAKYRRFLQRVVATPSAYKLQWASRPEGSAETTIVEMMSTGIIQPVTNDTGGLGTAALRWADAFVTTLDASDVGNHLIPQTNVTWDLGSTTGPKRWRKIWAQDVDLTGTTQAIGTVTSGVWNGTAVAVGYGGTGAANAADARTNLGLVIGTNVQAYDAGLADIAGLAVTDGNFIVGDGANWVAESGATARTSLGLGNVENTALSTWVGSANITTLGTITTGTWNAGGVTSSGTLDINGTGPHEIAGNLGLGVTPNANWYTSLTALQFGGQSALSSSTTAGASGVTHLSHNAYQHNTGPTWTRIVADEAVQFYMQDGAFVVRVAASDTAGSAITWAEKIVANNTGLGFYGAAAAAKQTVSGSRGSNAALASLLTALATIGLITDSSS